ncbi:hypothetical protein Micbo1qcDRAFT_146626 [Microdochium bolleyi]|uniref:Uncharacterized protein n=1 Tax=Microdochium bolleyi TaxID=196109 RepID=A0A136J3E9_9PEZI|nr:hypothetical protein Micbo1qcDRAFT_146626 [Microdochium bolleyi]
MPSDEKSHYTPPPPVPSYEEATRGYNNASSSSNQDWRPPASPIDTRPDSETEAQGLLSSSSRNAESSRRAPAGYQPPRVDTDDEEEGSEWTLESDRDDNDDDDDGNAADTDRLRSRRVMEELEVEDPLNGSASSGSQSARSQLWRKRIGRALPSWKWRWRMPRMTVRLPRASDNVAAGSGSNDPEAAEESAASRTIRERLRERMPVIDSNAAFILIGRLVGLTIVLGFLYLLFMSDLFTSMSRRIGGQMFDPEAVRQHVVMTIDTARMRDTLKHFTSYAHIAGTEGDYALAKDVYNHFLRSGLDEVHEDDYQVYLNYPTKDGRAVQIMSEDGKKAIWTAKLEELEVGGETAGHQTYAFHGHSKSGDVKGHLVYANYGSREDFKKLKDMGIDTNGAIALVRYYGTQGDRALKVKAAELAGFAGCLIYSDPADDGFLKGDVAPSGRFMPADGVQRGSVSLMSWVVGDVLTPGWESKPGLPRMKLEQTAGLVRIPSLPLAWRDAQILLQHIQGMGQPVTEAWRGGVPDVEWWTGNSSSPIVRLKNEQDEVEQKTIWNIYGKIVGIEQMEKSIIIGNHRDAWAFGASDPNSGTAVMLEVVRVFGDLVARGWRPLRSIEFMSWDAEEYNLIGSTEYVEGNIDELRKNAFAYVNLDTAVSGNEFHAAASPVYRKLLSRVLDRVQDPNHNASLRALWDKRNGELEGLGAGSDYVAFQDIAGTSSIDLHFDGPKHPYHSSYDNFDWMTRVGDPGFVYHNLLGRVLALVILELCDRPVLPFDMSNYALALNKYVGDLNKWVEDLKLQDKVNLSPVRDAVEEIRTAVGEFEKWEDEWERTIIHSNGWEPNGVTRQRIAHNSRMAAFETALLDLDSGGGIVNRTQFKHVVFGPQLWSGYDEAYFPNIRDAIDAEDWQLTESIIRKTARILRQAAVGLITNEPDS